MLEIACMLDITSSGELQNLLFERRYFFLQQLVIFHQGEVLSAIATNYRLLFEFFGTIRTFHLRLPAYFLLVACYIRKYEYSHYEYSHRRAVIACTITHITAETGRYGAGGRYGFVLRMKKPRLLYLVYGRKMRPRRACQTVPGSGPQRDREKL